MAEACAHGSNINNRLDYMRPNGTLDIIENEASLVVMNHTTVQGRNRNIACFRKCRITPGAQIHGLSPSLQPVAWLEVMASSLTTVEEKNEAMEEILILAKDKTHARMLLEEGILDSLMNILGGFFRKHPTLLQDKNEFDWPNPTTPTLPSPNSSNYHTKLAANCCIALGKAHCAIVHTEGDLLLMSAYNRGSVPVERQLAQMLFEVPHHTRVANIELDADEAEFGDFFVLTEMTMQQAEELAKSIKTVVDGRMDQIFFMEEFNTIETDAYL